ncbi:GTA baseplate fiber-binding domain-containing protein [Sphingorhabdus sp. Alg231-15]|uniref:GTA baseplate fiber-binding domain-containing protein n=1 Tax=Sphingorhabdus sp. Alg231-15 TaxID=1922222 RepID=UPI000D5573C8
MATLVLTAVGTAVGGPIGGALGAVLGQQIDQNILFKPSGREGHRLQELAVQTSSYGTQIPRIYGTMRVAGTVIWATDLKETRESSGGGKGRPSSATYSYSASLAVALSSRNISEIGRIWADGKIFRGSAGDFKTEAGFRFFQGHEDQAVDGLMASAEANGGTPAHRGIALAVFEDMDLTDYGNRIPSLTFEVIADDGSVSLGKIINDISGDKITASIDEQLHGFAAAGEDRREAVTIISDSFSLSFPSVSGALCAKSRQPEIDTEIVSLRGLIVSNHNGRPVERPETITVSEAKIPRQHALRYYEPERDYQSGLQNAFRPGTSRAILNQDFPAALASTQAKNIAQKRLWSLYQERSSTQLHVLCASPSLKPGTFVSWNDSGDIWLVRNWELNRGNISLVLSKAGDVLPNVDGPTDNGRPVQELDALAGMTRLALVDLPFALDAPMQVSDVPRLYAAATGDLGWRNAELLAGDTEDVTFDPIGQVTAPARIGTALEPLNSSGLHIIDRQNELLVQMHNRNMHLDHADQGRLLIGQNIASIGQEIIQFGSAEPIGDNRYILSHLYRGLGGTEREIDRHGANEDFILLSGADLAEIDPRYFTPFLPVTISALGRDDQFPVPMSIQEPGRALKPWSPVHPRHYFGQDGDLHISWVRRSRAGLLWPDSIEIPLAEEAEKYRFSINGQTIAEPSDPEVILSATQVQSYRDLDVSFLALEVRQIGQHNISDPLLFVIEI